MVLPTDSETSQTICDYNECSDIANNAVSMKRNAVTRTRWFCNRHAQQITGEWGFVHVCL